MRTEYKKLFTKWLKPSGSGAGNSNNKLDKRGYLSLEEVLNAVLESSEDSSDDECNNGNSSLEELSDFDDEALIEFVSNTPDPCFRDSRLYFDVSIHC